ncbi:MAG: hypothetical protein ABI743_08560 [bacterium]
MEVVIEPLPSGDCAFPDTLLTIGAPESPTKNPAVLFRLPAQAIMFGERMLYWQDRSKPPQWVRVGHEGPPGAERCAVLIGFASGANAQTTLQHLQSLTQRSDQGLDTVLSARFPHHPFKLDHPQEHAIQFPRVQLWKLQMADTNDDKPVYSITAELGFLTDWPGLITPVQRGEPICQYMFRVWESPIRGVERFGAIIHSE